MSCQTFVGVTKHFYARIQRQSPSYNVQIMRLPARQILVESLLPGAADLFNSILHTDKPRYVPTDMGLFISAKVTFANKSNSSESQNFANHTRR